MTTRRGERIETEHQTVEDILLGPCYCQECGKALVTKQKKDDRFDMFTGERRTLIWRECPALQPERWWYFWQWLTRITSNHFGHYQMGVGD